MEVPDIGIYDLCPVRAVEVCTEQLLVRQPLWFSLKATWLGFGPDVSGAGFSSGAEASNPPESAAEEATWTLHVKVGQGREISANPTSSSYDGSSIFDLYSSIRSSEQSMPAASKTIFSVSIFTEVELSGLK